MQTLSSAQYMTLLRSMTGKNQRVLSPTGPRVGKIRSVFRPLINIAVSGRAVMVATARYKTPNTKYGTIITGSLRKKSSFGVLPDLYKMPVTTKNAGSRAAAYLLSVASAKCMCTSTTFNMP